MKKKILRHVTGAAVAVFCLGISGTTVLAAPSLSQPGSEVAAEAAKEGQAGVENTAETMPKDTSDAVKFVVRNIKLDASELELNKEELSKLLEPTIDKMVSLDELNQTIQAITVYCRKQGYPAAAAYLPPQESHVGTVVIKVIPGRYGEVKLDNHSKLKDTVANGFLAGLKKGDIIRTSKLETALYSLSDVVGSKAIGVLSPGKEFGTSDITVRLNDDAKKNSTVAYVENYGSSSSGRYRYGLQESMTNASGMGDKLNLGLLLSNNNLHNYYVNYETLVGRGGTSLGIGFSRMDYQTGYEAVVATGGSTDGTANTVSLFGSTSIYHRTDGKMTLNYGFDYRKLQDNLSYGIAGTPFTVQNEGDKHSSAFHVGLNGYAKWPGLNVNYNAKLSAGNLSGDNTLRVSNGVQTIEQVQDTPAAGGFTKLEGSVQAVQSIGHTTDVMLKLSGQKASNTLDSSEQFYLGGANGVRAYPQGEGMGDDGWLGTLEFRYHTPVTGLVLTTYYDYGRVYCHDFSERNMTLKGWGIGLSYSCPEDWFARLDYARRIGLDPNAGKDADANGRFWFILGKIW